MAPGLRVVGRRLLFAAILSASVGASAAGASGVVARSATVPCTPKKTKVHGKLAYIGCGPATAALKVHGKTYRFKGGQCDKSGSSLVIDVGEVVSSDSKHNGGKPNFSLTVTHHTGGLVAYAGGRNLVVNYALATVPRGVTGKGTFKNTLTGLAFTGSWNCHGAIINTR